MATPTDRFTPITSPAPDWSAAANWSSGAVPLAGDTAAITGTTALIDPGVTIETSLGLATGASLIGNGGAIMLGTSADLAITGSAALYATDSIVNQGILALASGASLAVVVDIGALSGLTGAAPPSLANTGTIALATGATLAVTGTEFENEGLINLAGGTLAVVGGALDDAGGTTGTIDLSQGAVARFGDGVAHQSFTFGPGDGTLTFTDPLFGPGLTLSGFSGTDTILLPTLPDVRLTQGGGFVTITTDTGVIEGSVAVTGVPDLSIVDQAGGSAVVLSAAQPIAAPPMSGAPISGAPSPTNPPCFTRGTAILTPSGYRPVETLAAGDTVITTTGAIHPIIWTGRHTADLATHPDPAAIRPIRIAAGALAPGVPRRSLRVSPDHAILLAGVLIPAKLLVNGATIIQEHDTLAVTYHHVELARHDTILAEGAPCETYLDTGNRAGFSIATSWPIRPKHWDRDACAPLVTTGPILHQTRRTLHDLALAAGFAPVSIPSISLHIDGRSIPAEPTGRYQLPSRHGGLAVIRSHRFVPAHFDPVSEDRRSLGVALTAIRAARRRFTPDALADTGFHPRSPGDPARWTDGDGVIRIPHAARTLTIEIAATPLKWMPSTR
jgi:hypothetical protein